MSLRTALIFPGQGSQRLGMLDDDDFSWGERGKAPRQL